MAWTPDLLRRLNDHGVKYVVIGGVAAIAHGSARITEDLDLCAPLTHDNAVRIVTALSDLNPRWLTRPDLPPVTPDNPFLTHLKNMYLRTDGGRLDVLSELPGVGSFEDVSARSVEMGYESIRFRVISLQDLIAAKTFAGREKDQPALTELRVIQKRLEQNPSRTPDSDS